MLAALDRRDVDAVSAWEPWSSRILSAVQGTKILVSNEGIFAIRDYVYVNKGWAEKNPAAMKAFMLSMVEATKLLLEKPKEAAGYVAKTLKLEPAFTEQLMSRVDFEMRLNKEAVDHMKEIERQLSSTGKLVKPIVWDKIFWPEPWAAADPGAVTPMFKKLKAGGARGSHDCRDRRTDCPSHSQPQCRPLSRVVPCHHS
jgi:ABC-type nitrate/sulfonate/bicarbonate transport system substrate-binding protein